MIRKFKNILLVIRGRSEEKAAIQRAARLAMAHGARLTAMRVLRTLPSDVRILGAAMPADALEKMAVETTRSDLQQALRPAQEQGCRVQIKIVWGKHFIEVIREVLRRKHDLVILNASVKSRLRTSLFGSMTTRLMRKCPCPVFVVKATHRGRYSRVVAAVGPEGESDEAADLNRQILDWATSLAAWENSELHVVHAWELYGEGFLRGRAGVAEDEVAKMEDRIRKARKEWLTKLVAPYNSAGDPGRIHLIKGSAEVVIQQLIRRKKMNLLVMGSVCRTSVPGFFIGNTAERILSRVNCSVLTLKPEAFVTPVQIDRH